jgi:hypothetical protein
MRRSAVPAPARELSSSLRFSTNTFITDINWRKERSPAPPCREAALALTLICLFEPVFVTPRCAALLLLLLALATARFRWLLSLHNIDVRISRSHAVLPTPASFSARFTCEGEMDLLRTVSWFP